MIFNVVVYSVILHWVTVVAAIKVDAELLDVLVKDFAEYFYAGDGIIVYSQLDRLKKAFGVLTNLFGRFGLWVNKRK